MEKGSISTNKAGRQHLTNLWLLDDISISRHISRIYFSHFLVKHVLVPKQAKEEHGNHWLRLTLAWQRPWNGPSLYFTSQKPRSKKEAKVKGKNQMVNNKDQQRSQRGVKNALCLASTKDGLWNRSVSQLMRVYFVINIHFFRPCRLFSIFVHFFDLFGHQGLLVSWVSLADDSTLRCFTMEVVSAAKMTVLQQFYQQFQRKEASAVAFILKMIFRI